MPRGQPGTPVTLRESQLLSEYLAFAYPGKRVILQPRLGQPGPQTNGVELSAAELRFIGVWRRYPDAVVLLPDRVVIVECSLKPDPGKISMVDLYARLFPMTPEFDEYRSYPIERLLVWGVPDGATEALAREGGIRVVVYQPAWVLDWLNGLRARDKRTAQVAV